MKSNKGQALIEFVLVLPIFLLILFCIIDFGRIIYEKNRLENIISDAITLINNGELSDAAIKKTLEKDYGVSLNFVINRNNKHTNIKLSTSIDVITPGLGIAISNPFVTEVSRVIYNE